MAYFSIDETTKGSANINKIRRKKEKHVWSAQIMDELLKRASMYEYGDDGNKPLQILGDKGQETGPYSFDEGDNVTLADITEEQQHATIKGEPRQQKNGKTLNSTTIWLLDYNFEIWILFIGVSIATVLLLLFKKFLFKYSFNEFD